MSTEQPNIRLSSWVWDSFNGPVDHSERWVGDALVFALAIDDRDCGEAVSELHVLEGARTKGSEWVLQAVLTDPVVLENGQVADYDDHERELVPAAEADARGWREA